MLIAYLKRQPQSSQPVPTRTRGSGYGQRLWLTVLVALLAWVAGPLASPLAQAQEALWEPHIAPNDLVSNQLVPGKTGKLSVERAIRIVRRETGGRVLAAAAGTRKGHPGVNVRTLLDGERVTTFFVYADGRLQKR